QIVVAVMDIVGDVGDDPGVQYEVDELMRGTRVWRTGRNQQRVVGDVRTLFGDREGKIQVEAGGARAPFGNRVVTRPGHRHAQFIAGKLVEVIARVKHADVRAHGQDEFLGRVQILDA